MFGTILLSVVILMLFRAMPPGMTSDTEAPSL
jgi:hypothetical protein